MQHGSIGSPIFFYVFFVFFVAPLTSHFLYHQPKTMRPAVILTFPRDNLFS
jgi:hypothetical protein